MPGEKSRGEKPKTELPKPEVPSLMEEQRRSRFLGFLGVRPDETHPQLPKPLGLKSGFSLGKVVCFVSAGLAIGMGLIAPVGADVIQFKDGKTVREAQVQVYEDFVVYEDILRHTRIVPADSVKSVEVTRGQRVDRPMTYSEHNGLGLRLLQKEKRYEDAIREFDRALQLNPNDPSVWYNKALALFSLGFDLYDDGPKLNRHNHHHIPARNEAWRESSKCLDRALELDPSNQKYSDSRATLSKHMGDKPGLMSRLLNRLARHPTTAVAEQLAAIQGTTPEEVLKQRGIFSRMEDAYRDWYHRHPFFGLLSVLGGIYGAVSAVLHPIRKSSERRAEEARRKAKKKAEEEERRRRLEPTKRPIEDWHADGIKQIKKGEYVGALKCFDMVHALDPRYPEMWFYGGVANEMLGEQAKTIREWSVRAKKAVGCYDEELEINPDHEEARYRSNKLRDERLAVEPGSITDGQKETYVARWLGHLYDMEYHYSTHGRSPETLRRIEREQVDAKKGLPLQLGSIRDIKAHQKARQLAERILFGQEAEQEAKEGRLYDWKFARREHRRAEVLGEMEAREQAHRRVLQELNAEIISKPSSAEVWYTKGEYLVSMEHHMDAIRYFDIAVELDPKYPNAWFLRGFANEMIGRQQNALMDYRRQLKIDPRHREARKQLPPLLRLHKRIEAEAAAEAAAAAEMEAREQAEREQEERPPWNNDG